MKIKIQGRSLNVDVHKLSEFGKFTGLMFRTKNTKNLLFIFNKKRKYSIHSFFVFFNFMAVWLDDKDNILEWKIVNPFTFRVAPRSEFSTMIEIPFNKGNNKLIEFIVDKGKGLNIDVS